MKTTNLLKRSICFRTLTLFLCCVSLAHLIIVLGMLMSKGVITTPHDRDALFPLIFTLHYKVLVSSPVKVIIIFVIKDMRDDKQTKNNILNTFMSIMISSPLKSTAKLSILYFITLSLI
jgi:hypothetical protein